MVNCESSHVDETVDNLEVKKGDSTTKVMIVTCLYCFIILVTILGNLFVILAYKRDRNIRRSVGNIFIVNLAVVGLIIGSCLLTVNCIWLITDDWIFGEYPCKVWLVVDYTTSYMLVVSMIFISLDRLRQIRLGMSYFKVQTFYRAMLMIAAAWLSLLVYYSVVIFGWSYFSGRYVIDYSDNCEMETICSQKYNLAMVFVEFLFPFGVLLFLNLRVFWEIRLRANGMVHLGTSFTDSIGQDDHGGDNGFEERISRCFSWAKRVRCMSPHSGETTVEQGASTKLNYIINSDSNDGPRKKARIVAAEASNSREDCAFEGVALSTMLEKQKESLRGEIGGTRFGQVVPRSQSLNSADGKEPTHSPSYEDVKEENNEHELDVSRSIITGKREHVNIPKTAEAEATGQVINGNSNPVVISDNPTDATPNPMNEQIATGNAKIIGKQLNVQTIEKLQKLLPRKRTLPRHKEEVRHCVKAGVTLALLVGVFVVCWLPITCLTFFFSSYTISELWWEIASNLLWCNATLNPILYALTNAHFRNAFCQFPVIRKIRNSRRRT